MRIARSAAGRTTAARAAMIGALALLGGCHSLAGLVQGREIRPAKVAGAPAPDCSQGGAGCHPTDRRQYYDSRTARYYYFDPASGRYYWENGDPRF